MFTAPLSVRDQLQTARQTAAADLTAATHMGIERSDVSVVHLHHSSIRRGSFMRSPSTPRKH